MWIDLLFVATVMAFTLFVMYLPMIEKSKLFTKLKMADEIFEVFAYIFLSRLISFSIYICIVTLIANTFDDTLSMSHQVTLIALPFLVILFLDVAIDYYFCKKYLCNYSNEISERITNLISFSAKILATIFVTFILGIKDTAYALVETFNVSILNVFVKDLFLTYIATTLTCFDCTLEFALKNASKQINESNRHKC